MSLRDWSVKYFYLNAFLLIAIIVTVSSIASRFLATYDIYYTLDPFLVGESIGTGLVLGALIAIIPTIGFAIYKRSKHGRW